MTRKDAEIAMLRAEVERLRADAERYRWLRDKIRSSHATADGTHFHGDGIAVTMPPPGIVYITDDSRKALDTAIDAARAALGAEK